MGEEEEVDYDDHHDDHHHHDYDDDHYYDWDVCFDETLWWWSWCTQRVRVVVSATFSTVQRKSKLHNKLTGFSELLLQNLPCLLIIAVPMLMIIRQRRGVVRCTIGLLKPLLQLLKSFFFPVLISPWLLIRPWLELEFETFFFCGLWRILRRIFLVSSQGVLKLSEHYPHPNPEKRKSEKKIHFQCNNANNHSLKFWWRCWPWWWSWS